MRDSVPNASYSSVCNVLREWSISLIPTYKVYRLCDYGVLDELVLAVKYFGSFEKTTISF